MARFKKVSHYYQNYELNICDICDLPFNDYNNCDVCDSCLEKQEGQALKRLRIKLGWLSLYRAIVKGEDAKTARRRILEIATSESGYKLSRLLKKTA